MDRIHYTYNTRAFKEGDKVIINTTSSVLPSGTEVTITEVEPDQYDGDLIYYVSTGPRGDWVEAGHVKAATSATSTTSATEGQYLVYSNASSKAPSRWYFTHKQAKYVARKMTVEHGETFYVLRATEKYVPGTVVKEIL
jgi:hypothetical protein